MRDALKLAGGKGYRGTQVVLKASPDSGWASHLAKDYRKPFPFGRFAATRGLRAAAEDVFDELRAMVLNSGKQNDPPSEYYSLMNCVYAETKCIKHEIYPLFPFA